MTPPIPAVLCGVMQTSVYKTYQLGSRRNYYQYNILITMLEFTCTLLTLDRGKMFVELLCVVCSFLVHGDLRKTLASRPRHCNMDTYNVHSLSY
jgi:hypothetical protein